jgi:hypothetical protein
MSVWVEALLLRTQTIYASSHPRQRYRILSLHPGEDAGNVRRLESCRAVVRLNHLVLLATAMIRASRNSSATWKRFDTSLISKGYEIRDVWHRQVRGRSLRLLEPFIGVVGFDYVITLKFQHFS